MSGYKRWKYNQAHHAGKTMVITLELATFRSRASNDSVCASIYDDSLVWFVIKTTINQLVLLHSCCYPTKRQSRGTATFCTRHSLRLCNSAAKVCSSSFWRCTSGRLAFVTNIVRYLLSYLRSTKCISSLHIQVLYMVTSWMMCNAYIYNISYNVPAKIVPSSPNATQE